MKLFEILALVPKDQQVIVEVYSASDKEKMIYAYWVRPNDKKELDSLEREMNKKVICVYASTDQYWMPELRIEIVDDY